MKCRICSAEASGLFNANVLLRYDVEFFQCKSCGFVQTEDPYWLDKSYQEPINREDTGIVARNLRLADIASLTIFSMYKRNAMFLDYAGGTGLLVRLMRDRGYDFYWHDKYTDNLFARGFEGNPAGRGYELLTCFEAMEHFSDPQKEINEMLSMSRNLLFTTELLPSPAPSPGDWWYYGIDHGQHVSFYSLRTLQHIASGRNLNLYSNGVDTHLLTEKKIPPLLFSILVRLAPFGIGKIPQLFLKSRTFQDMLDLSGSVGRKSGKIDL